MNRELEHLLRTEAPQVLGALVRRFGRFDIAEDAVQEALLTAGRTWPVEGVPENPRSWLIRVGYRRMVDLLRSDQARHRRELQAGVADLAMREPGRRADPAAWRSWTTSTAATTWTGTRSPGNGSTRSAPTCAR
ncbi:sigma factor [Nonomuraea sp. NPDC003560]|uniref:sigma factor n=1 Tax=Nonomuraea sp. NPDC003560 TaxID=3364341 RepID=UPI003698AA5E